MVVEREEGWGFPGSSRKAHYIVDNRSLCRNWGWSSHLFGPLEQGKDDSPDNCSACMRALAKRKAKVKQY